MGAGRLFRIMSRWEVFLYYETIALAAHGSQEVQCRHLLHGELPYLPVL